MGGSPEILIVDLIEYILHDVLRRERQKHSRGICCKPVRRCRPSPYLNNVIEQDHRFIKKRIAASLWFRSADGALRTLDGYEAMHLIRKGQIRWLPKGDVIGQRQFIHTLFGIAV